MLGVSFPALCAMLMARRPPRGVVAGVATHALARLLRWYARSALYTDGASPASDALSCLRASADGSVCSSMSGIG